MLDVGYGVGHRLEIGAPFGVYWEDGFGNAGERFDEALYPVIMPYIKIGLLPDTSHHHLAVFGQSVFAAPAIVGIRYGLERSGWEPHIGLTWMVSAFPSGDSPLVTRYQQEDQFLYLLSAGVTWLGPGRPTVEAGVLSNRYRDPSRSSRVRNSLEFRTLYDFFVSIRVGLGR